MGVLIFEFLGVSGLWVFLIVFSHFGVIDELQLVSEMVYDYQFSEEFIIGCIES